MVSAVETFLGNLHRSLSPVRGAYRVVAINEPYINEVLDRCRVLERVGSGAMSVVYKAQQETTDRLVALKMLRSQLACDPSNVKRFQREAKAIARLSHPNLLNVYSVGQTKSGQPYMIMDFVQGKSLADVIAAEGNIEWKRCGAIFMQVCDAMQHAHANRIIHRDLKPDNIMLVANGEQRDLVKVVDFGIVKITDESQALSQRLTQTGEIWGSPVYMSPEQCMGNELDARSDIYSLGTVMFECLTGKQLFESKRITDIVMKQLNEKPASFADARPDLDIPAWLELVVRQALEKEPKNRFASMEEMKRAIEKGMMARKDTAEMMAKPTAPVSKAMQEKASGNPRMLSGRPDMLVGTVIGGKYHVKSLVGEGGMSVVYKAIQEGINRPVAIKLLRDELCDDDSNVKRFKRESKAVSQLSHPNLVGIYDVGVADTGQPYMVMEFLEGLSLIDVIEKTGPIFVDRAIPIFIQICDVMNYAHSKGYIHRDLKPHNIMLVKAGEKPDFVKLVDFGIVAMDQNMQSVSQKLTAAGEICGSPLYMSPEQVLDTGVDGRSDVYSLGVMMYEALAGHPPFGGKRITDVMQKHIHSAPPPFSQVCPQAQIPPEVEGVIFKALEKAPEARYQSMDYLKQALLRVTGRADSRPGSASFAMANPAKEVKKLAPPVQPPPPPVVPAKSAAKNGLMTMLVAMAIGAVLAAGAVYVFVIAPKANPSQSPAKQPAQQKVGSQGQVKAPELATPDTTPQKGDTPQASVVTIQKPTKPKRGSGHHKPRETLSDELNAIERANLRGHSDEYSH